MKDPKSDNSQLGHFLTAVDIGGYGIRKIGTTGLFVGPHAVAAMIGHEKAQTEKAAATSTYAWWNASWADVRDFTLASDTLGDGLDGREINIKGAQKILGSISIGNEEIGAHRQDLVASLVGYNFGTLVETGRFKSREQAAGWIRLNVGGHKNN